MIPCRGGLQLLKQLHPNSAQGLQKVWGSRPTFRLDLVAHFGKTNRKKVEKAMKRKGIYRPPDNYLTDEELQAVRPIEEVAASIDTTLTEEQKEYVAKLRKKMRGGDRSPRSLYREVPLPHEVVGDVGYMPLMAPNAEALIDYALSTIPRRAGPRRSRRKKRFLLKARLKKEFDDKKKIQRKEAHIRKVARIQRIEEEVRQVREQAAAIRLKQQQAQQRAE